MKKKERILRIRPFNMANFSGGYGYMPVFALYAMIIAVPATLIILAGCASSIKKGNGMLNYQILKRRLNYIMLPICLISFVMCFVIFVGSVLDYGGGLWVYMPSIVWAAAIPTIGLYMVAFLSAKRLNKANKLITKKILLITLGFGILLVILGWIILLLMIMLAGYADMPNI